MVGTRFSRRSILATIPVAAAAGLLAGCSQPPSSSELGLGENGALWAVPDAAFHRRLGDHPPGATGSAPPINASPGFDVVSRTKRGVPVGGIGTGSFMYNLAGSFGPWHLAIGADDSAGTQWGQLKNTAFEQRFLSQAAFHSRIDVGGETSVVTLATEDVLPAWKKLSVGQGTYSALFPKAWFQYDGLPLPVALKQITPYVARNEQLSSLPAGLFQIAVTNPKSVPADVSFMLSFPNAPFRMDTQSWPYPRSGLHSVPVRGGGVVGVRLQAEDPVNVHETQKTEWVIAAQGPAGADLTYTTNWNEDGDGADLWKAFSRNGRLPNGAVDSSGTAGAVAVSFQLQPHETQVASFALTWDFPVVQFRNPDYGTLWWKRYTEWYGGPYRGWAIAQDVLSNDIDLEGAIDDWWAPIVEDDAYPAWLRTAALNELFYDIFGGTFWENGCITRPKKVGVCQNLYFELETDVYQDCSSLDVRHYGARHTLELFPSIERALLLGWGEFVMLDPEGRTPHDTGSPINDPWFVANQYGGCDIVQLPSTPAVTDAIPETAPCNWLDLPPKFVQQAYAYWTYTGDDEFAEQIYPAVIRTMEHLLSLDTNGDGIPDPPENRLHPDKTFCNTYDNVPMQGAAIYIAGLTIGALEATRAFAQVFGTVADNAKWRSAADKARASTESVLWSETDGYYHLDQKGYYAAGNYAPALMTDALCGQRYVQTAGPLTGVGTLPDILDRDRMIQHLTKVYEKNVVANGNGQWGAVNASGYTFTPPSVQVQATWPGASYFTAAIMYTLGKQTRSQELMSAALATGFGAYRTTYEEETAAFWFDTPAIWTAPIQSPTQLIPLAYRGPSYQRNRAAWELLVAVKEPLPPLTEQSQFNEVT